MTGHTTILTFYGFVTLIEFFHVPEAETEPEIYQNSSFDDIWMEAMGE